MFFARTRIFTTFRRIHQKSFLFQDLGRRKSLIIMVHTFRALKTSLNRSAERALTVIWRGHFYSINTWKWECGYFIIKRLLTAAIFSEIHDDSQAPTIKQWFETHWGQMIFRSCMLYTSKMHGIIVWNDFWSNFEFPHPNYPNIKKGILKMGNIRLTRGRERCEWRVKQSDWKRWERALMNSISFTLILSTSYIYF